MRAEFFDMKLLALGSASVYASKIHNMSVIEFALYDHMVVGASFDSGTAAWKAKLKYEAVRPITAIHFVKAGQKVSAWGGAGLGTVTDMPGEQWRPYLPTPDHTEYPSGSTCFCAAHAEASRRYFHSDDFGMSFPFPKGSSVIEPGITPANDIVVTWPTYTDFANQCAQARVDAGAHFPSAVQASLDRCTRGGAKAYEVVMKHINGDVGPNDSEDSSDD